MAVYISAPTTPTRQRWIEVGTGQLYILVNTASSFVLHIQLRRREVMQQCADAPSEQKSSDGAGGEAARAEGHTNASRDSC